LIELEAIKAARERIAGIAVRTPLIRLEQDPLPRSRGPLDSPHEANGLRRDPEEASFAGWGVGGVPGAAGGGGSGSHSLADYVIVSSPCRLSLCDRVLA